MQLMTKRMLLCLAALAAIGSAAFAPDAAGQAGTPATVPVRRPAPQPQNVAAAAPDWFPLPKDQAEYLDKVLKFWEFQTGKIERYRCQFKRWEYDQISVGDPNVPKTYAEGAIKYAAPDKGLYVVEKATQVVLPLTPGQAPKYDPIDRALNEHWVCDGKSIYEFDGLNEQLIQRALPPEMQGRQIVEGPLPFMFGAKAEAVKQRYWIRVVLPPPKPKAFWLEAVPKTREDAADFKLAHIIIAEDDFLPEGIVLYHRNQARTTFAFENRESNWLDIVEKLNIFHREFHQPQTPPGWKKIVDKYVPPPAVPVANPRPPAAGQPTASRPTPAPLRGPQQATRPRNGVTR
jgi:TIGR03009 family protein